MGILGWIAGGCVIGAGVAATILTGGAAAAPALAVALKMGTVGAGTVLGTGAAVGATAGAVVGVVAEAASSHDTPRTKGGSRYIASDIDMEEDEDWRTEEEERVSRPVQSRWIIHVDLGELEEVRDWRQREEEEFVSSPVHREWRLIADMEKKKRKEEERDRRRREEEEKVSKQPFMVFCVLRCNNRDNKTQSHSGTGTQMHHRSTSKQDCETEATAGGGSPGGDGGWSDGEDGDSDQEKRDSEEESEDEESQQNSKRKRKNRSQHKCKRQKRVDPVKVLTANLWSLNNKELKVLTLIEENQVDVACLTETFLDQNIADGLLSRASGPDFNYQFRNRQGPVGLRRPKRSGGVAIVFSTDLLGEPCHFGSTTTFEYDARLVQHREWIRPIVFICLYRRPGQTRRVLDPFLRELEKLLDQARLVSQSIIVTGDFNIWVDQETRASNMFQSFLNRNHLRQHVNQPTHCSGHTLDLVLTRNVQISDVSVGNNLIKDHYPVFCKARPGQSSEEEEEEEEEEMFQ